MRNSVLGLSDKLDFYFYQRPVPMNKGIEALRGLVINEFGRDPGDGAVYIFISKGMKENLHDVYSQDIQRTFRLPSL